MNIFQTEDQVLDEAKYHCHFYHVGFTLDWAGEFEWLEDFTEKHANNKPYLYWTIFRGDNFVTEMIVFENRYFMDHYIKDHNISTNQKIIFFSYED